MTRHPLLSRIEQLLGCTLHPAPDRPDDPLGALMAFKADTPKYLLADEVLIGLNLARTGLTDAQWQTISQWPEFQAAQFQALNLSENELKEVVIDAPFRGLQRLNLCQNSSLKRLHFEVMTPALTWMDVSKCALSELVLPAGLTKLFYLDLHQNQLNKLVVGYPLLALDRLDLRNNQLTELPENLHQYAQLKSLYLNGNKLVDIPQEVVPGGDWSNAASSVLAYLQEKHKSTSKMVPLHQAKMILVGNGEVGKTSIRCKLLDRDAPLPLAHERTETLDIAPYPIRGLSPELTGLEESIDFQLNIWDFGGQGKYREIQQLFCSRKSLYLFVTAFDDLPSKEDYVGFEYWLDMINAYSYDSGEGKHSPVIHVVNKIDKEAARIDEDQRHTTFSNIQEFLKISCKEKLNLDELEATIQKVLPFISKDVFTDRYPASWMAVREKLEEESEANYVPFSDYLALCQKQGINEQAAGEWIRILNRIGVVIYFGDHPALRDWVILNPLWVKEIMYGVLESRFVIDGVLKPMYLADVWPEYEEAEHQKFLALMLAYQLCYAESNAYGEIEYVIPSRLRTDIPLPQHLRKDPAYRLRFVYDPFIPAGTVNKLMVLLNQTASDPRGQVGAEERFAEEVKEKHALPSSGLTTYLRWKNNLVLHDPRGEKNAFAHVWEAWEEKAVYLDLYGGHARELFERLQAGLQQINQTLRDTRYLHQLSLQPEGWFKNRWRNLNELTELDVDFFSSPAKSRTKGKTAFFVYSSADESYRAELDKHFATLKRLGKLDTWHDRKILPGEEWDHAIQQQLRQSDLVLLLLSPDFLNVDYIWEKELEILKERSGSATIVPIFLRACDTEGLWFMEKQGAGKRKGWIASESDPNRRDELWLEIVEHLKKVL